MFTALLGVELAAFKKRGIAVGAADLHFAAATVHKQKHSTVVGLPRAINTVILLA